MASNELPYELALNKKEKEAVDGLRKTAFSIAALQEARHEVAR